MAAGEIYTSITEDITAATISGAVAAAIAATSAASRVTLTPIGMGQNILVTAIEV